MISVLIPVYNRNIQRLAEIISAQCISAGVEWEMRIYEDGSTLHLSENKALEGIDKVVYKALPQNIGRSAIRNMLADDARFEKLLFLDCDSVPESVAFMAKVLAAPQGVVYGGTVYHKPSDARYSLHYRYGSRREALKTDLRKKQPYTSFRTNNFIAPKSIFREIRFDERLRHYGHEDTLFASELRKRRKLISHIDNPVWHDGLEEANRFLEKSRLALENGWKMVQMGLLSSDDIRIIAYYNRLLKRPGGRVILSLLDRNRERFERNLAGNDPRLRYFDLLRLIWLKEIAASNLIR